MLKAEFSVVAVFIVCCQAASILKFFEWFRQKGRQETFKPTVTESYVTSKFIPNNYVTIEYITRNKGDYDSRNDMYIDSELITEWTTPKHTTTTDPTQLVKRYQMECVEETRVDADLIAKIKRGYWNMSREKLQLVKEWALCVMMKAGLMTKQGVYKIDVALSRVPKKDRDHIEKLIDSCLATKAIPAPDIAYRFIKCYQRTKANHTVTILY